ncbi:MAG: FKBP-type peptidyl-prolyl cis-trans isomerase [Candidatus Burarchaeum sp.]|nr:FKBP-type peptidyl-prolyl cis-trans isomerase [Candidatus Burarchaeum sp.]MDO8339287.1 FKBP-type peptidyl-prolyl cis-trans isomerase [Candidatus Burarchaeum sp.]
MKYLFLTFAISILLLGCAGQQSPPANETATPQTTAPSLPSAPAPAAPSLVVEKGDAVAVDYVGYLDNGEVFDTSIKAEAENAGLSLRPSYAPLAFTVGAGEMIAGFDAGVVGMKVGEEKTVHILPKDAYGERFDTLVMVLPRSQVQGDVKVGSELQSAEGYTGRVISINSTDIEIDFNDRLAGMPLNFRIIMRSITKPTS